MKRNLYRLFGVLLCMIFVSSCSSEENDVDPAEPAVVSLVKGADISWVTEMEANGQKFFDASGKEKDCFQLMKEIGMNAIRLRVWVNPTAGYNGKDDVVAKAERAKNAGLDVMIDFHYSDSWADPSKQVKPAAWANLSLADLKTALASHTTDVLNALKAKGISPKWIQIGNEIRSGILWDTDASVSGATWTDTEGKYQKQQENLDNFVAFLNTGYDAAKTVFPSAKIIAHCDNGDVWNDLKWVYGDILAARKAKYDVIGLSCYPGVSYQNPVNSLISNIKTLISTYGKPVMVVEFGMPWDSASAAYTCIRSLLSQMAQIENCQGLFYWEPECRPSSGYTLGAFDEKGYPTHAMDAFKD